jgi:hypothetical protein
MEEYAGDFIYHNKVKIRLVELAQGIQTHDDLFSRDGFLALVSSIVDKTELMQLLVIFVGQEALIGDKEHLDFGTGTVFGQVVKTERLGLAHAHLALDDEQGDQGIGLHLRLAIGLVPGDGEISAVESAGAIERDELVDDGSVCVERDGKALFAGALLIKAAVGRIPGVIAVLEIRSIVLMSAFGVRTVIVRAHLLVDIKVAVKLGKKGALIDGQIIAF